MQDKIHIVHCTVYCCRDMSVDSTEENNVDTVESVTVDGNVISSVKDDAVGTFEIEHDLLLESAENTDVAPTGLMCFMVLMSLSRLTGLISAKLH